MDAQSVKHELTMLYLSKNDISDLSPSELVEKYRKVYGEISKTYSETAGKAKLNTF